MIVTITRRARHVLLGAALVLGGSGAAIASTTDTKTEKTDAKAATASITPGVSGPAGASDNRWLTGHQRATRRAERRRSASRSRRGRESVEERRLRREREYLQHRRERNQLAERYATRDPDDRVLADMDRQILERRAEFDEIYREYLRRHSR